MRISTGFTTPSKRYLGGGGFLRVLFSMIIRKGAIDASSSDEVITFMRRNDENARKALLKMFRPDWV